jgi:phenylpropionate dioxygenase-like ring-hydroxylating dioxygenase large terminal subunit
MPVNTFVENAWYVAGRSREFPVNQPKGLKIAGRPVLVWRTGEGRIVSFDDRCVHKRMPLSEGEVLSDGVLECPYHGFCYDASGHCVRIPSQLDLPIPSRAKLRPFPVVEQDDLVWVWTGDPAMIGEAVAPRTPELGSPEWETHMFDPVHVPANYVLLIENLMDITHFYPLHDGNIGDIEQSKIPVEQVEEKLNGVATVKTVRRVQNYKQPPFMADWFGFPVVDRWHTHHMIGPGLTRVELRCAAPGKLGSAPDERGYVIHHAHTPIDGTNHTWRLWVSTRTGSVAASDPTRSLTSRIAETFPAVMDEDRWALERQQRMFEYPDDGYHEVYLRSDKALLRCRKILEEMEQKNRLQAPPAPAPAQKVA